VVVDEPTFNWWMKECNAALFKPVLLALVAEFKTEFKALSKSTASDSRVLENLDTGYKLEIDASIQDNQFHPDNFEGAGEIINKHGHLAILFFATLLQRINEVPGLAGKLTLCDEQGEQISLNDWSDLKIEIKRMGFNPNTARTDAEAIGFVDAIIHLDQLVTNKPRIFF
jgi:hypothetical protein